LQQLKKLPFVTGAVRRISGTNGIRLVVEQANKAIPALLEWCRQEFVNVDSIEEYLPPFDDVFVELVNDETNSN
ncbi:MAG: hypothetical protein D6768_08080, partial [Chloroflexi bacterium]